MADENVVVEEVKIPDTVYFVSWYLHNGTNNGWAYKVENKYTAKDAAEKAYFSLLGTYVGGDTYDIVVCILSDSDGMTWEIKRWPDIVPTDEDMVES